MVCANPVFASVEGVWELETGAEVRVVPDKAARPPEPNVTDIKSLLQRARGRDPDAVHALLNLHEEPIVSGVRRGIRGSGMDPVETTDDVRSNLWIKFTQQPGKGGSKALPRYWQKLNGWFYKVSRNEAVTMRRKRKREQRRESEFTEPAARPDGIDSGVENGVVDGITIEWALDQLSDQHREAIELRYFKRWSAAKVGKKMGYTENAMRRIIQQAREALADILNEAGEDRNEP